MATALGCWRFCGVLLGLLFPITRGLPTRITAETVPYDAVDQKCWTTKGVFEQDCYHAEPLLNSYPLSEAMFNRSVPYNTPDPLFHRAFQRARKFGLLRVIVLGGSVTYGHKAISPTGLENMECAWPRRLEQWFANKVQDFRVELVNHGRPGQSAMHFLRESIDRILPKDLDVDIIIVDFGVNDAIVHPEMVIMAHEKIVRHVRNVMIQDPALLYVESFMAPARVLLAPEQGVNMAEVHSKVTRKYDIPMASFRHAVWPDITHPETADRVWGSEVHPDWQVQQLMADVAAFFFQRSYARFLEIYGPLSDPSPDEKAFNKFDQGLGCVGSERSTSIQFGWYVGTPPPKQLVSMDGWSFLNTGNQKGFVAFGNSSTPAVATLDIICTGQKRSLDIEYLAGYVGMGAIAVVIDSNENEQPLSSAVFDGLWKSVATVPWVESMPVPGVSESVRVTVTVLSAENEKISGEHLVDGGMNTNNMRGDRKFKLIGLHCC